ncbi:MAG: hypothetical protein IT378_15120 [Sandaracinaceae bacterium]|nr:hypothetical protein [Sandaracinaceae bacterium]
MRARWPSVAISLVPILALLIAGCAGRYVAVVQRSHGREFSCAARFVEVEGGGQDNRFVSRGCGFEAQWSCVQSECTLRDSRAWGMGAQ